MTDNPYTQLEKVQTIIEIAKLRLPVRTKGREGSCKNIRNARSVFPNNHNYAMKDIRQSTVIFRKKRIVPVFDGSVENSNNVLSGQIKVT
jgi:hypothetical protein